METVSFVKRTPFTSRIVLVDGFARSGKHLHNPIISSFTKVQPWVLTHQIDSIPYLLKLKKIGRDFAIETLKRECDYHYLTAHMSRGVNFRFSDYSSIWNTSNPKYFFEQLFNKQTEKEVFTSIKNAESPWALHLATHDTLFAEGGELFLECFPEIKILNCRRNPVDIVFSAIQKGWPERMGTDPLSFWFSFNSNTSNYPLPWWATHWEESYLSMSNTERIIEALSLSYVSEENSKNQLNLDKKIAQNIFFEAACYKPDLYLEELESFIGIKKSNRTFEVINNQRLPRTLSRDEFNSKLSFIKENSREIYFNKLTNLVDRFENDFFSSYGTYTFDLRR